jgi:uncharacterized protein (DUF362 family)
MTRLSRREFLKAAGVGTAVAGLTTACASCSNTPHAPGASQGPPRETEIAKPPAAAPAPGRARVISRSDPAAFGTDGLDAARVADRVNQTISALVDVKDPREAFRALFSPDDVVAIKVNCLAGPGLSSSPQVVDAVVAGLRSIGIPFTSIWIFERTTAELERAGFTPNLDSESRPRCVGNDVGGFTDKLSSSGAVGSLWSRVLASRATALVNVPVLKDHDLAGVGCSMKNMYGAIHNPNRYHDNNCDPYVADVGAHPFVRDKLRLVVVDALTAQYDGGPARVQTNQWRPAAVLASRDPVATDRVAQQLIEVERAAHGLATLAEAKRPPRWIDTAAARGLGENDLEKIELDQG